jgi:hypothetical protein
VPEFIDPVFAKTSPKRLFSIIENERFGFVFAKTGSINSGTVFLTSRLWNLSIFSYVTDQEEEISHFVMEKNCGIVFEQENFVSGVRKC